MSDSRKAKWKELKAGAAKPVNPELKKLIETPTNPAYGTIYTEKDPKTEPPLTVVGVDPGFNTPDAIVHSLVLDPTIRAENNDLKQQLAQKIGVIDTLTETHRAQIDDLTAAGNSQAETIRDLRLALTEAQAQIDDLTAPAPAPAPDEVAAPPADAIDAFKSFIFTPAGRDLTDYRIPTEPGRLVGVLEDRARVAFLEGFRIGRGE